MALKQSTPAFESMDTSDSATSAAAPAVDQPAAAAVPATVKNNLPVVGGQFKTALVQFQDVLSTADIEGLGYGTFPRVTADLGGLLMDSDEIGKFATLDILSWNLRYVISPNSNDEKAKKLVKISYDGQTVSGSGESVHDAVEALKAQGFEKAASKLYIDIWAMLKSSEKLGDLAEPKMVQVQLSPESVKQFKRFQLEQGIKEAQGGKPATSMRIESERQEYNGNRYARLLFSAA